MIRRPPESFRRDVTLGPLIARFVERINRLSMPGARATSWWRSPESNVSAGGAEWSQHLLGLAVDVVAPRPHELVALAQRAGLTAIYHNAGSGWHVHVQAYPRGFVSRLLEQRPWLGPALGLTRQAAPSWPISIPYDPRAVRT